MNQGNRGFVGYDALGVAMKEQTLAPEFEILASEPLLSAYIAHEVNSVIGKLALAGCPTEVLQLVDRDLRQITGTAVRAVQQAYRTFMEEFLPGEEPGDDSPGTTPPHDQLNQGE